MSSGYVFITNIPAGASDIQIIERHKTENILGENLQLLLGPSNIIATDVKLKKCYSQ